MIAWAETAEDEAPSAALLQWKQPMLAGLAFMVLLQAQQPTAPGQLEYEEATRMLQQGRAPAAVALLSQAVKQYPGVAPLWRMHGVALAQTGDLMNAADSFGTACRISPALPDACYYLGRSLYSLNRFNEAIDALRRAVRVDFVKARSETALAEAFEALGQLREAEQYFHWAILRGDRAQERALLSYGRFLVRAGRTEESLEPIKQALKNNPKSPDAHFQMARVLLQLDRVNEATPPAEKALSLDAANPQYKLLLARIYRRSGRDAEAEKLEKQ